MRALERACVERGVAFEEGAEVLELVRRQGGALEAVRIRRAQGDDGHDPLPAGGAGLRRLERPADARRCRWPPSRGRCSRCRGPEKP